MRICSHDYRDITTFLNIPNLESPRIRSGINSLLYRLKRPELISKFQFRADNLLYTS